MKYIVREYQEGCEPSSGMGHETLAEARKAAKRKLTINDGKLGRKMKKHSHVIDDEMGGYEAIESWTPVGGNHGDNETDFVTIFRRRAV